MRWLAAAAAEEEEEEEEFTQNRTRAGVPPSSCLCQHLLLPSPSIDTFHLPIIWSTSGLLSSSSQMGLCYPDPLSHLFRMFKSLSSYSSSSSFRQRHDSTNKDQPQSKNFQVALLPAEPSSVAGWYGVARVRGSILVDTSRWRCPG